MAFEVLFARLNGGLVLRRAQIRLSALFSIWPPTPTEGAEKPMIELQNAHIGSLEDNGGEGFRDGYALHMEGMEYGALENFDPKYVRSYFIPDTSPRLLDLSNPGMSAWQRRLYWLNQRYPDREPTAALYNSDTYDRLARYYRSVGESDNARRVANARINYDRRFRAPWLIHPFLWLYSVFFQNGLSPTRAIYTFLGCLALGWMAVIVADAGIPGTPIAPALVVETTSVNSVVATEPRTHRRTPAFILGAPGTSVLAELPCGEQIEPLLYAIDTFVPGVSLRQRERCAVSSAGWALPWRLGAAVYSILGWIVTSITLLTLSGILRRQAEA